MSRAVPWIDWSEWAAVREQIFSDDRYLISKAIVRIATWRSRSVMQHQQRDAAHSTQHSSSDTPHNAHLFIRDMAGRSGRVPIAVQATAALFEIRLAESARSPTVRAPSPPLQPSLLQQPQRPPQRATFCVLVCWLCVLDVLCVPCVLCVVRAACAAVAVCAACAAAVCAVRAVLGLEATGRLGQHPACRTT